MRHQIPNISNYEDCKINSEFWKHICHTYHGACSLEYQTSDQDFQMYVQWDQKTNNKRKKDIFWRLLEFAHACEEQGQRLFIQTSEFGSKIYQHKYVKVYGTLILMIEIKPGRNFIGTLTKLLMQHSK